MVNVCQLPMYIFNQTVFGSGFYLYTITEAQWYIFRNIQTIYKKWRVPYTFILLEATVKLWLMFSTSVPTQNDIKT